VVVEALDVGDRLIGKLLSLSVLSLAILPFRVVFAAFSDDFFSLYMWKSSFNYFTNINTNTNSLFFLQCSTKPTCHEEYIPNLFQFCCWKYEYSYFSMTRKNFVSINIVNINHAAGSTILDILCNTPTHISKKVTKCSNS